MQSSEEAVRRELEAARADLEAVRGHSTDTEQKLTNALSAINALGRRGGRVSVAATRASPPVLLPLIHTSEPTRPY